MLRQEAGSSKATRTRSQTISLRRHWVIQRCCCCYCCCWWCFCSIARDQTPPAYSCCCCCCCWHTCLPLGPCVCTCLLLFLLLLLTSKDWNSDFFLSLTAHSAARQRERGREREVGRFRQMTMLITHRHGKGMCAQQCQRRQRHTDSQSHCCARG